MKLLVTGGTGFIGSNFIQLLTEHKIDALVLRRKGSTPRINLAKQVNWMEGELNSFNSNLIRSCTHFVHFASYGVHDQNNWQKCFQTNVIDSLDAVKIAIEAGIDKFAIIGSCFEYGLSAMEFKEIPASAPLKPVNAYGASKAAASMTISSFLEKFGKAFTIYRLFHIFGEGEDRNRFWPSLVNAAKSGQDFKMTKGEQIRDFSDVKIASKILLHDILAMENDRSIKNIGSGRVMSLKDFAKGWWKKLDAKGKLEIGAIPYAQNEIMSYIPEID